MVRQFSAIKSVMDSTNILWITLDSVRADHTNLDEYERDTTPEIAALGRDGHAFRNCISHGKATLTSSGAILTGLAPTRNTLGVSGRMLPDGDGVRTVADRFSDAGYHTACLSRNSFVSSATGLDRGFDQMQWLASETILEAGPLTLAKYLMNIRSHSAGLTTDTAKHATPYLMNETAKKWLGSFEAADEPFFFYLHYNEPHRPYYPPLDYIDEYTDGLGITGREAAERALEIHQNLKELIATGCDLSDRDWDLLAAMYDAEIAYTDDMVGGLVDHVRSMDLEDTVVVVTADHGELFGEYGLMSHKYVLIDAVTRVPLVISGLDDDLMVNSDDVIQHSDVMTTLLEIAGADASGTIGTDLRKTAPEFAISQRGPVEFDDLYQFDDSFDASRFHQPTLSAIRTEEYRYQQSEGGAELFALPDEETDVSDEHPDVVDDLSASLGQWIEEHGQPIGRGQSSEFSGAVNRQLRDLGYID
ncbi:sulfatase [Halobacteria archaeon HArc-gm2]|nr:sulfatase [Halobacteria archaeon HArc-gm2]